MHDAGIGQQARVRHHADLLVQGGTVLTPNGAERIDVACADGCIIALGDLQSTWSAEIKLDGTGLYVLPGVIDSQVHFREPGLTHKEDLETGMRGAVLGGVTSIFGMLNTHPLTLWEADLQAKLDAARGRAWDVRQTTTGAMWKAPSRLHNGSSAWPPKRTAACMCCT